MTTFLQPKSYTSGPTSSVHGGLSALGSSFTSWLRLTTSKVVCNTELGVSWEFLVFCFCFLLFVFIWYYRSRITSLTVPTQYLITIT